MKKCIFTLLFSLIALSGTWAAPISIDTISAKTFFIGSPRAGIDSLAFVQIDTNTVLPSFAPATNHFWDLTNLGYGKKGARVRMRADGNYRYGDSIAYQFDSVKYWAHGLTAYGLQGILQNRLQVDSQTSLIKTPGGFVDTFITYYQLINYVNAPAYYILPFPISYSTHDNWKSSYGYTTWVTVTDTSLGLKKAPGRRITYITETDTVVGYGAMRVNKTDSDLVAHKLKFTAYKNVTQIKVVRKEVDTFIMPKPAVFANVGIKPYYSFNTYQYDFYQLGSVTPLARVIFTDSTFSTVKSIAVHTDSVVLPSLGIENVVTSKDITIYPNPAVNGKVNVMLPENATGNWAYQVMDITGRAVTAGELQVIGGQRNVSVSLPNNMLPGVYIFRVLNNNAPAHTGILQVK